MRKADHELEGAPKGARGDRDGRAGEKPQRGLERDRERDQAAGQKPRAAGLRSPLRVDPALIADLGSIADAAGCELLHAELKGNVLRLILDREDGGVSLGDCEYISKQASALLDVVDFGKGRYVLEVSSPGLDRQLYGERDYQRFVGRLIKVTFENPDGRRRTVTGRLRTFTPPVPATEAGGGPGEITVAFEKNGEPTGEELQIGLDRIKLARLEIEL